MTDIEKQALALVNEVETERGYPVTVKYAREEFSTIEALCRAIEQHEAFKLEVSDAVERAVNDCGHDGLRKAYIHSRFFHFIIAKPDPLVEVINDADDMVRKPDAPSYAEAIRAAIEARGGRIVWEGDND